MGIERRKVLRDSTPILAFPLSKGEGIEKNIHFHVTLASLPAASLLFHRRGKAMPSVGPTRVPHETCTGTS